MRNSIINPAGVIAAEVVVGLPSYNEADNIGRVVRQVSRGLRQYFPRLSAVIVNCDNHSSDQTRQVFLATSADVPKIYVSTPYGVTGKGYNYFNLYSLAVRLKARLIMVIDADVRSVTPAWIKYFGEPVLRGYDYVTPLYARHKYDGTITNSVCYPLLYGLLGYDIRQPIGGDFAFSSRLCRYWLRQKNSAAVLGYGIDIFQSSHAILGNFRICQTGLGSKIHKPSAPKLGPMFSQVVEAFFRIITDNKPKWSRVRTVRKTPKFGLKKLGPPQRLTVDPLPIQAKALAGFKEHQADIRKYLAPTQYGAVAAMFRKQVVAISPELWTSILYDMVQAYRTAAQPAAVVEALKPLYFGRVASFIQQTTAWSTPKAEQEVLRQARLFFKMRHYLIDKIS